MSFRELLIDSLFCGSRRRISFASCSSSRRRFCGGLVLDEQSFPLACRSAEQGEGLGGMGGRGLPGALEAAQLGSLHTTSALTDQDVEGQWELQGGSPGGDAPIAAARSTAVQRALRAMQECVEEPLPMNQVARRVGLTQRALEQRFRSELGAAPRTVYRRIRLLAARKLVDETRLPVGEIALRCGYESPSATTRAFAAEFGLTPRDIRKAV